LEESLGTRLLERTTGAGGIRVTPAGARLLSAASGALSLLEDACAEIRGTTTRLTVSASVSLSTMWLAQRLAEFSASLSHDSDQRHHPRCGMLSSPS
jgi:LysR family transcriptional regulator, glycine cleavage system transcriptional activator